MVSFSPRVPLFGSIPVRFAIGPMILVAIGSNLAAMNGYSPYQICNKAVEALAALPELMPTAVSPWYRSAPVPRSDQPDYVNGIVRLGLSPGAAEPEPAALLTALQRIENAHGRARGLRNAARTLDLDIIAMGAGGATVRDRPDPMLPHPRAHLRAFVLLPLRDVAPDWVHPVLHSSISELIDRLPPEELAPEAIRRIVSLRHPDLA